MYRPCGSEADTSEYMCFMTFCNEMVLTYGVDLSHIRTHDLLL